MTGNFYCVPSSCARVVWRKYLSPAIRYRYSPTDEWTYVDGDDYTIDNSCLDSLVVAHGTYINLELQTCEQVLPWKTEFSYIGTFEYLQAINSQLRIVYSFIGGDGNKRYGSVAAVDNSSYYQDQILYLRSRTDCVPTTRPARTSTDPSFWEFSYEEIIEEGVNCNCTLTIYKNEQIVYEETRDICPEVEQLDCRLSEEIREIRIEKTAFLERVEVVDYSYISLGGNIFRGDIPDECLNILKNLTTQIIPLPGGVPTPDNGAFDTENRGFVEQICSASGCPPPEYEVICDCDCETCPNGTCAVLCGDHICCYDTSTGISVQQIALDDFCPDEPIANDGNESSSGTDFNYDLYRDDNPRPTQQG